MPRGRVQPGLGQSLGRGCGDVPARPRGSRRSRERRPSPPPVPSGDGGELRRRPRCRGRHVRPGATAGRRARRRGPSRVSCWASCAAASKPRCVSAKLVDSGLRGAEAMRADGDLWGVTTALGFTDMNLVQLGRFSESSAVESDYAAARRAARQPHERGHGGPVPRNTGLLQHRRPRRARGASRAPIWTSLSNEAGSGAATRARGSGWPSSCAATGMRRASGSSVGPTNPPPGALAGFCWGSWFQYLAFSGRRAEALRVPRREARRAAHTRTTQHVDRVDAPVRVHRGTLRAGRARRARRVARPRGRGAGAPAPSPRATSKAGSWSEWQASPRRRRQVGCRGGPLPPGTASRRRASTPGGTPRDSTVLRPDAHRAGRPGRHGPGPDAPR